MGGHNTWQSSDSSEAEEKEEDTNDVEVLEVTTTRKVLADIGKYNYYPPELHIYCRLRSSSHFHFKLKYYICM